MPYWLQIVVGIAVPAIALFSALITYQQWRVGQRTLTHHLFDRRWRVYTATHDVLVAHLTGDDEDQNQAGSEFARRKVDALFLFPPTVVAFVQETHEAVFALRASERALKKSQNKDEALAAQVDCREKTSVLRALHVRLPGVFRASLDLTK
ncbi:hypothetical protein [Cupriavidus basilensis]|uniref:Uncharacterized protein n=1 Tax=Cupriavidus basilensis TaxID=68895 RepID=A0A643FSJ9_9BURK|nr:hypothetical protein [Cupriavidus basilensis]QOT82217.1 hypothetical protein F7R26_039590 [Cupriavidus basilensis]